MTVPLPHFQRFASNFRPTSKKASGDSNPSPFLWLYSNPSPFLWWAAAVFFRRCLAMMVSPSPPPLQQRSRDLPPDQDLIFEALQVPSAVAAFKSKMSYQNIQHFQRFGHVEKYPMKLMKLREWDFDIGFMQWDMFFFNRTIVEKVRKFPEMVLRKILKMIDFGQRIIPNRFGRLEEGSSNIRKTCKIDLHILHNYCVTILSYYP